MAINDVLNKNTVKTAVVNGAAKRVYDLTKHCDEPFKKMLLWQVMLSRMLEGNFR